MTERQGRTEEEEEEKIKKQRIRVTEEGEGRGEEREMAERWPKECEKGRKKHERKKRE